MKVTEKSNVIDLPSFLPRNIKPYTPRKKKALKEIPLDLNLVELTYILRIMVRYAAGRKVVSQFCFNLMKKLYCEIKGNKWS
tara:strand:+ start:216 stop:461 length:246 start_codon:yes stop_codon:yes gene_type:complete